MTIQAMLEAIILVMTDDDDELLDFVNAGSAVRWIEVPALPRAGDSITLLHTHFGEVSLVSWGEVTPPPPVPRFIPTVIARILAGTWADALELKELLELDGYDVRDV